MPLLAAEPNLYPDDLLAVGHASAEGRWWVLHARPRAEKSLARRLLAQDTAYYLPIRNQRWSANGRRFESFVPLFPGYVFLHAPAESRPVVLATGMVANFIPVTEQDRLVSDLRQVHRVLTAGLPVATRSSLPAGTQVTVVDGALEGVTGTVVTAGKAVTVCVEIRLIGQGVLVDLPESMLRPVVAR